VIERRKFLRFPVHVFMRYRYYHTIETEGISPVEDMSRGGMRFLAFRGLDKGTLLDMMLDLPGCTRPVYLRGEVAWAQQEEAEHKACRFAVGIKFFKIDNFDKARLLDYVYGEWLRGSVLQ